MTDVPHTVNPRIFLSRSHALAQGLYYGQTAREYMDDLNEVGVTHTWQVFKQMLVENTDPELIAAAKKGFRNGYGAAEAIDEEDSNG